MPHTTVRQPLSPLKLVTVNFVCSQTQAATSFAFRPNTRASSCFSTYARQAGVRVHCLLFTDGKHKRISSTAKVRHLAGVIITVRPSKTFSICFSGGVLAYLEGSDTTRVRRVHVRLGNREKTMNDVVRHLKVMPGFKALDYSRVNITHLGVEIDRTLCLGAVGIISGSHIIMQ